MDAADTPLSSRILLLWRLGWLAGTGLLLVIALLFAALAADAPAAARVLPTVLVGAVGIVLTVLVPAASYRRWRYGVTDDGVEIRHGLLVRQESSIPHFRVQHIDLHQGPLDRWRGIVKLSISTASPATDATLPGIEPEQARTLRARILERAEADDGV
ncbi:MAG: PH domain-containing protein [Acidimicrobiales bacterium]|nr:PH domain-containing protein [Acidimicrobiales bacterium]HRW38575.1 PH domain-containing protein [Aquihabitans sp.]